MIEAIYPNKGCRFKHKTREGSYPLVIFLGKGASIDEYEQITEAEYQAMLEKGDEEIL